MNIRKIAVYLPLIGAIACGPSTPGCETVKPGMEARQAEYLDVTIQILKNPRYTNVTRNGITERKYPTHTCLIEPRPDSHRPDSHIFYCDLESNDKGLDSVSHVIRATDQDGQDRWVDGITKYAIGAFPDGFDLEGIFSLITEHLERKSPAWQLLERDYAKARKNFNK